MDVVKKKPKTKPKKKPKKRARRVKPEDDCGQFAEDQWQMKVGPFQLHSPYRSPFAGPHFPAHCYTSEPIDVYDPKAVRKHLNNVAQYLGRLQRRTAKSGHTERRGRKWDVKNRMAWKMMHDNAGKYTWIDVFRKLRVLRDYTSRRKLQVAFAVARGRHVERYPECFSCRRYEATIPDRRHKAEAKVAA